MAKDCHDCRYTLPNEPSPYCRCLLEYNQATTKEKIKNGLIGRCDDWKQVLPTADDRNETLGE